MLQKYVQHQTLEEYQCLLPASKNPNQSKTKKTQTLPLFVAKTQFPTTRFYIKSMNTSHQFFSKAQIYLRKDIPNVGIIWTAVGSSPITAVSFAVIITLSQTIFCWIKITFMRSNGSNNKMLYGTALKKMQSNSFIQSQDFTRGATWPCNPNGSPFPFVLHFSRKFRVRRFVYGYFVAGCISYFLYLII